MTDEQAFSLLKSYADAFADGHFTILKFTTNYRVEVGSEFHSNAQMGDLSRARSESLFDEGDDSWDCVRRIPEHRNFSDAVESAVMRHIKNKMREVKK